MKQFFIFLILIGISISAKAQLNVTFRSNVTYGQSLNDIWGYAADDREYAIVGLRNGVNIVDVTDPENPTDMGTATGPSSTWRDMKTWDNYAYITNETEGGILIIDMSNLPNPITTDDWYYVEPSIAGLGTITSCHNIFIDEFGFAYLAGCDVNSGGPVIFDLKSTPGQLDYVGRTPAVYAHDVYTIENKLYTSDIYNGEFSIYDVTDKANLNLLGAQPTEADFTHNVWINDAHTVAFTTDEVAGAPVGAYDISDPTNIIELDQFRPIETLGDGVIPHNVHVWNDWVITSYYTDGCIILDGSEPDNMIEVGNFDSFIPASTGFDGIWGAYPFLPSGTILATDIGNGLYVLSPNYVRACRLAGNVTNAVSGDALADVDVSIDQSQPNMGLSDFQGDYKTGIATAGTFNVTYSKVGYESVVLSLPFENGVNLVQDVALQPLGAISGVVIESGSGAPVPNANIALQSGTTEISVFSNADGSFQFPGVNEGTYEVFVGAWGYKLLVENVDLSQGISTSFILEPGYEDDFAVDLGWQVAGNANTGAWELGVPVGTDFNGTPSNPGVDASADVGDKCYVTGNGGGGAGTDDVDDGETRLVSPAMDLSDYDYPIVEFEYWWFNEGGSSTPNDELLIRLTNNSESVTLPAITTAAQWSKFTLNIPDYITPDDNTVIEFITGDQANTGHLVEAGIDAFKVQDASDVGIYPNFSSDQQIGCTPFTVNYSDLSDSTTAYNWSFPGGNPTNSTDAAPVVVYETPGVYSASLEATVTSGATYTVTRNAYINVTGSPFASYSYANSNGVVSFSGNVSGADNFSWDFGDGTTSTDLNPNHTFTADGTYVVILSAENDCGTFDFESEVVIVISSIYDPISGSTISTFPNPFDQEFTLKYDLGNENNAELFVFNSAGQTVKTINLGTNNGQVVLGQDLPAGVYFVGLSVQGRMLEHIKMVKF